MTGKDAFGFGGIDAPPPASKPGVDISSFQPKPSPAIDRVAADAALRAGEAGGYSSRARQPPAAPRGRNKNPGRARLSDIVGRPAAIEGVKAQMNMTAPAELIVRFKEISRRRGDDAQWQTLSAALDALEAEKDNG